jgi:hypothetical protein
VSGLFHRIGGFFVEPPPDAAPGTPAERTGPLGLAPSTAERGTLHGFAPPRAGAPPTYGAAPASGAARVYDAAPATGAAPVYDAPPATDAPPPTDAAPSAAWGDSLLEPSPGTGAAPGDAAPAGEAHAGSPAAVGAEAAPVFAAVVGGAAAVPVAAAAAGELRAQARAAAAVLCVWGGGEAPAGATTPAVRRLAARLAAQDLPGTACGRLVWVPLAAAPEAAAAQVERVRGRSGVPLVLAIAASRPAALEPLIAGADHALAVLPAEADDTLRALALATLPHRRSRVVAPLPPGPPRWAAMAGLARLRALRADDR